VWPTDDDILPVSGVEHYAYCPRQGALIHLDGVWADNAHTARGSVEHSAVDRKTRLVRRHGFDCWLSLPVGSERLRIRGVCDAVELTPAPLPVEHKPVRSRAHLAPAAQQLALQAMCLEEMFGTDVSEGVLYSGKEHRREVVEIDGELREAALKSLAGFRSMLDARALPERASDRRCRYCSLHEFCLVDEEGASIATGSATTFALQPAGAW